MTETQRQRLKDHLRELSPGPFRLSELYGSGWYALPIGERVRIGREFLNEVNRGAYLGVQDTGKKKGGGRVYVLLDV